MKIKVLEVFDKKKQEKFLIERYYKKLDHIEYIICEKYNFQSNTYINGVSLFNMLQAYHTFNTFCDTGILNRNDVDDCEDDEDGEVEDIN